MARPDKTIKVANIQLAIWTNKGDKFDSQSVTITKSYKDKNGEYQNTSSFKFSELHFIKMAIEEALKYKYVKDNPLDDKEF